MAPEEGYAKFIEMCNKGKITFSGIVLNNGDEPYDAEAITGSILGGNTVVAKRDFSGSSLARTVFVISPEETDFELAVPYDIDADSINDIFNLFVQNCDISYIAISLIGNLNAIQVDICSRNIMYNKRHYQTFFEEMYDIDLRFGVWEPERYCTIAEVPKINIGREKWGVKTLIPTPTGDWKLEMIRCYFEINVCNVVSQYKEAEKAKTFNKDDAKEMIIAKKQTAKIISGRPICEGIIANGTVFKDGISLDQLWGESTIQVVLNGEYDASAKSRSFTFSTIADVQNIVMKFVDDSMCGSVSIGFTPDSNCALISSKWCPRVFSQKHVEKILGKAPKKKTFSK